MIRIVLASVLGLTLAILEQGARAADQATIDQALDLGDCPSLAAYSSAASVFTNDDTKLHTFICLCQAHINIFNIVGSSPYSLGNDICVSALHAGAIKRGVSSQVVLRWVPSPPVFKGSTRNGVEASSRSDSDRQGAFVVIPAQ